MKLYNEIDIRTLITSTTPVIVECGSNNGSTTVKFLDIFPQAQVFCFEADPRTIAIFKNQVKKYGNRCKLYEVAVTNKDGYVPFYQSYGTASGHPKGSVHMDASTIKGIEPMLKKFDWLRYKEPIQVVAMKLDTWLGSTDVSYIDFMWVDVEGAEGDLILGGTETLKRTHYFYTEYKDDMNFSGGVSSGDILNLLPDFELVKKWEYDMLLHNKNWRGV